jgi:hypothetical protein
LAAHDAAARIRQVARRAELVGEEVSRLPAAAMPRSRAGLLRNPLQSIIIQLAAIGKHLAQPGG